MLIATRTRKNPTQIHLKYISKMEIHINFKYFHKTAKDVLFVTFSCHRVLTFVTMQPVCDDITLRKKIPQSYLKCRLNPYFPFRSLFKVGMITSLIYLNLQYATVTYISIS